MSADHQVAALLFMAALIVTVVQALRWLDAHIDNRLNTHRAKAAQRPLHSECEFEATARRWHAAPPVMAWTDEIEDQCREWTDADDRDIAAYLADRPYNWAEERDGL